MDSSKQAALARAADGSGAILALTGAGISAESGIPTFRGPEGYWTVGSEEYHPMEMATHAAYRLMPEEVWRWYLYRRGVCRAATPNPAHDALARLGAAFGERFRLITQNVDGLHLRAGSPLAQTYQIHGNIDYMRCGQDCCTEVWPVPDELANRGRDSELTAADAELLVCPACGAMSRPHVLWFDECYDEPLFRFESSLRAAARADLLLIVGSSATTNLPIQVAQLAARTGALIVDINIEENPFGALADATAQGFTLRRPAAQTVPAVVDLLVTGA